MHEYSVARNLVEIACEEAERASAIRINRVSVRIGAMRMIDARLIQEAWVIACEGTLCEDARLVVETCAPQVTCRDCGHISDLKDWDEECPACGSDSGRVTGGD
jgi:hydrogenase nickel incorporation protein HypA/HybF